MATARLLKNHSIGRVAVLQSARGTGIGYKTMRAVIDQAKAEQRKFVKLSSQVHAIGFIRTWVLTCGVKNIWIAAFHI